MNDIEIIARIFSNSPPDLLAGQDGAVYGVAVGGGGGGDQGRARGPGGHQLSGVY